MKIGMRTPSWKKSLSARTSGRAKRAIKRAIIPGYGRRGMGIFHPQKALYNRVYRRTTFSIFDLLKTSNTRRNRGNQRSNANIGNSGCVVLLLIVVVLIGMSLFTGMA